MKFDAMNGAGDEVCGGAIMGIEGDIVGFEVFFTRKVVFLQIQLGCFAAK